MKKTYALIIAFLLASNAYADNDVYAIESSVDVDGGNLLVNGVEFAAKGFCHDYQFGDSVIFLNGSPEGACTEALLLNLRNNESCDVWCQYPL
jgi:hypothetical protein